MRRLSGTGEGVDDAVLAKFVKAALCINGSTITDQGLAVLGKLPKLKHFGLHHGPQASK